MLFGTYQKRLMRNDKLKELYQHYVKAANAREFDVIAELIHEQVTLNGVLHKREDVLFSLKAITDAIPDLVWHIEDLLTTEERIAARLRDTGTPTSRWFELEPTGAAIEFTEFAHYKVRDGRFAEMWFLMDVAAVAKQLGD